MGENSLNGCCANRKCKRTVVDDAAAVLVDVLCRCMAVLIDAKCQTVVWFIG